MPRGDLILFMVVVAGAILFAEMQARQVATTRWLCLALVWIVTMGMCIWLAYGA